MVTREVMVVFEAVYMLGPGPFHFFALLIISMTFVLSLAQMLVFLSLYICVTLLSILVCAAAGFLCACSVSVQVSASYAIAECKHESLGLQLFFCF